MPVEIILPKVDMDMATGRISRWFVTDGAAVAKGDVLFEIETDKAAMEIDAPSAGTIRDITGKEGIDIPVGQAVAWIYADGEATRTQGGDSSAFVSPERTKTEALTSPLWGGRAEGAGGDSEGRPDTPTPALRADPPSKEKGKGRRDGPVRASPLARRLARESGLDLETISGSGPHGRIVRADVDAVSSNGSGNTSLSDTLRVSNQRRDGDGGVSGGQTPLGSDPTLKLFEPGSYDLVPHDTMRQTIARRLVEAKSTIPHFYLSIDCEIDALLALRNQINAAAPLKKDETGEAPAYKLSVNDMVVKALAMALMAVPDANVSWTDQAMIRHSHADVGVAVSVPGGLITPIVRNADAKRLSVISGEVKDLAARARARRLKPEEYRGGTTTVSNLGMFGVREFAAIVNPPQATILAVGAGEQRPIVRHGVVTVATMMSVTLSTDHRAVDGALAAELLAAFKRYVEQPIGMLA